ncbi:hypothetical protein ACN47E_003207 [Coniothyrium glycines]
MVYLLHLFLAGIVSARCYEPQTAHPPPDYDPYDPILQDAFAEINTALTIAVAAPEFAAHSFSIEVTSQKETLWSTHHTARKRNASRPDIPEVNGDALYRIASISKAFTVLGLLYQHEVGNVSLDETVNTYIKELGEKSVGGIPWKDITLRSLASQLSGIPREFAQGDILGSILDPSQLGLPPVSRKGLPKCDEYSENYKIPCTAADMLRAIDPKPPLFAPNQKSSYSNLAFDLLGLVLSRVTNRTFEDYITGTIFEPLNMTTTTLSLPPDSAGVIPFEPQYWDVDEGIQKPTGGIYSSSSDLSKFLRYILTHYNAVTHAINWLHPVSPSRGLNSFYGMPWEILQTDRILKDSRRTVQFVTKGGGLPGYTSMIITIPDYSLGITILVAGGRQNLMARILEIVTVATVRAAEHLSIRQLNERYAGTYKSLDPALNSTVRVEADHRGLIISKFVSNSTDFLTSPLTKLFNADHWYAQLSPTLLYRDEKHQEGEEWRMLFAEERQESIGGIWDDFCSENIDSSMYAGMPLNEAVFWGKDKKGRFTTLELTAFRVNLTRVEEKGRDNRMDEQEMLEL